MLHLLYEALNEQVGIKIPTEEPQKLVCELQRERTKAKKLPYYDEELSNLKIFKFIDEVWIIHQKFCKGNQIDERKIREELSKENDTPGKIRY